MPSVRLGVTLKGSEQMKAIFDAVGTPTFMRAMSRAVFNEANRAMRAAKAEVPLEDGPLRASGTVLEPTIGGSTWSVTLGFGGAASAYALIQHENLTFNHKPGRKAKYLESPVRRALPAIEARLARSVANYFTPTDYGAASGAQAARVALSNAEAASNADSGWGG